MPRRGRSSPTRSSGTGRSGPCSGRRTTRVRGGSRRRCWRRPRRRRVRRGVPRRGRKGSVSLVGAGPGDPGLLTLGALLRLREADVVIYDRLVSDDVLSLIPRGVVKVYGGKE